MNCSLCGTPISPTDTSCRGCDLPLSPAPLSLSTPDPVSHPLCGVGGWLLFFIFTLVFFGPAAHLFSSLLAYHSSIEAFARSPHSYSLYEFYFAEQILGVVVYGYSVFAGIQLWKLRRGAVPTAKRFLLTLLLYRFADFMMGLLWVALMTPEGTHSLAVVSFLSGQNTRTLLNAVVYSALWYAYLYKSERVRVTFLATPG